MTVNEMRVSLMNRFEAKLSSGQGLIAPIAEQYIRCRCQQVEPVQILC
jgi:hypothetical protein